MASIGEVLLRKWPGASWSVAGDQYSGLTWLSPGDAPSEAEIRAWSDAVDLEMAWEQVRATRNRLLAASDWTQLADAPVSSLAWAVYRQALRDVPQTHEDPAEVIWPEQPE
ncbi:tail fiber assembly protein [Iodidimonas sp. SYSU 1G8]|uniref:tail fiber assembly protein n=1 Tax=Iodidimonas sp. SYSU 1G8 TaxID=3133967 RepID=UPI0031FEED9C